jgi:diketogulonate reductase-like aldo/keto reductase
MTLIPRLGLGTWEMGDDASRRDTAEMYGAGRSESLVGDAILGRRNQTFLVTKVLPENASTKGVVRACERSLRRLGTDRVDLYLLHWPGPHPIAETVAGFERLVADGKVLRWGVSNFDVDDLDAMAAVDGGARCAGNQVYYNLVHRSAERRVAPWCRARGVVVQAYTPLDRGRIVDADAVRRIARRHGVAPSAVALAWTVREPGTSAVAKTSRADRVRELAAALTLTLTADDLRELDDAFPPPTRDGALETL